MTRVSVSRRLPCVRPNDIARLSLPCRASPDGNLNLGEASWEDAHQAGTSMGIPSSKFSKTMATGVRVFLKTHAPLTFPGTLSTAGH